MKTVPSFEMFKKTMTKYNGKTERRFFDIYGNVSFEEAYQVYFKNISQMFSTADKINSFENLLRSLGVVETQSNVSESRYYNYNGMKYRFSSHIHPTGSMTSDNCIDLAANPEMIHNINF